MAAVSLIIERALACSSDLLQLPTDKSLLANSHAILIHVFTTLRRRNWTTSLQTSALILFLYHFMSQIR